MAVVKEIEIVFDAKARNQGLASAGARQQFSGELYTPWGRWGNQSGKRPNFGGDVNRFLSRGNRRAQENSPSNSSFLTGR